MEKQNILIVGDFNRSDFLLPAKCLQDKLNFFFLEVLDEYEVKSSECKKFGTVIFWKDFSDAEALLRKVKPVKVLFYFIETYNHVALNLMCKNLGIPTYHIEHGLRYYPLTKVIKKQIAETVTINTFQKVVLRVKKLKRLYSRYKNKRFWINTKRKLSANYSAFLQEYVTIRSSKSIFETFEIVNNPLRTADKYISFSPKIYEFHKISDHLPDDKPVSFIGCPQFDNLASLLNIKNTGDDLLLIDQPFVEQNLLGWNQEYRNGFLLGLANMAEALNKKLWIKIHPYSKMQSYDVVKEKKHIRIIQTDSEFNEAIGSSKVIIGFVSTLLMPLMALPFTTCFSLEVHPKPVAIDLSQFLCDSGALEKLINLDELKSKVENIETSFNYQKQNKKYFIDNWMYKFDGKSTDRLRAILLDNETF